TGLGPTRGGPPVDGRVAEADGPGGRDGTGTGVERRRLAGAVGADEPGDLAGGGVEVDVADGDEAAEADGQVAGRQPHRCRRSGHEAPPVPSASRRAQATGRSRRASRRGERTNQADRIRPGPAEAAMAARPNATGTYATHEAATEPGSTA